MTALTTRRGAMATAIVGAAAVVTRSVAADKAPTGTSNDHSLGTVRRGTDGRMQLALRIIAADDFKPVGGVEVFLTFVGRGADGGGAIESSDRDGIVRFNVSPGPWQINLTPPQGTRYCQTEFSKIENMLTVQPDGSCFPTLFRIAVRETEWQELRDHVRNAN